MPRPGRKPTDLRRLDLRLEFATEDEGQRVRDAGGGPWVLALIQTALGNGGANARTELKRALREARAVVATLEELAKL